ncbi:hypothetical protein L4X12_006701 [Pseudomonas aeruginosa]|jgi:hypothetical protein|nr:hypothetical protein [Salmonella enterica subsp. enterica serovar Infantis]
MQSMTLEQLRTASEAGGVSGVTLKGQGGAFLVQIATRNGSGAVLAKARSSEPRRFGNPATAINVLRDVGITIGQFDASEWNPAEREPVERSDSRAQALRKAHEAAAYNEWLAAEIQESIDDPRPSIPHDEVMARMDARIARHKAAGAKRA